MNASRMSNASVTRMLIMLVTGLMLPTARASAQDGTSVSPAAAPAPATPAVAADDDDLSPGPGAAVAYPVEEPPLTEPHDAAGGLVGPPPPLPPRRPSPPTPEGTWAWPAQVRPPVTPDRPRVLAPAARPVRGGFESVQVNTDNNGNNVVGDAANESSIAVDPNDPELMAIGWRQFDTINSSFREAGIAYSRDGGRTWVNLGVLDPGVFRTDPVLRPDALGNFYYSSLSTPELRSVEVFRSTDGGRSWGGPVAASGGDKQWIAVNPRPGLGEGLVHQIWNVQFSCCPPNDFCRSIDFAASFQPPLALPDPRMKWGTMEIGPDGSLYLGGATQNQTTQLITRSDDAQDPDVRPTFRFVNFVDMGGSTRSHAGFGSPNPDGLLGQVNVGIDHSDGPSRGNVYMLASVNPPDADPLDVFIVRSTDRGQTFSRPVRVNDDPSNAGVWQWLGTLSVAESGRLDAVWDDTRNGGGDVKLSELFYAWSTDEGATWSPNVAITPQFNSHLGFPRQNKMGDYNDMVSTRAGALLTYCATFNGEQDIYFSRLQIDCNENGVHDGDDIAEGTSRDDNRNRIPDECESCTGNEAIAKAACRLRGDVGKLTVKLRGGSPRDSFRVEIAGGAFVDGQLNQAGKGKARFRGLPPGAGTATAAWGCGAQQQREYLCE